jgi:hypothetical protein
MQFADLDLNKIYTYADYLKWQFEERVELILGKIYKMGVPNRIHQKNIRIYIGKIILLPGTPPMRPIYCPF